MLVWKAVVLGIVEGVTEFLPISSTGHLILISEVVNYPEARRATFEIFIQLGAILAIVWLYRDHLFGLLRRAAGDATARDLLGKVLLAFLPAALAGLLFHAAIEARLFHPRVVALALILGGLAILLLEQRRWSPGVRDIEAVTWRQALWIGVGQTLSLIPGVSRAAATIVGGLLTGLDRPVATQFSFYLSIPTLAAASLYSLFKARNDLVAADFAPLAVGFVVSFVSALVVVRAFITFVQRHTFAGFGYYRIALGLLVLAVVG
jgi:undecaprenyl-diphosphatase